MIAKETYTLRGAMEVPKEVAENTEAPLVLKLTYSNDEVIKIKIR